MTAPSQPAHSLGNSGWFLDAAHDGAAQPTWNAAPTFLDSSERPMLIRSRDANSTVRVNAPFRALFGLCAPQLAERPLLDWIQPDDRAHFEALLNAGEGTCEARHATDTGHWLPMQWKVRDDVDGLMILGLLEPVGAKPRESRPIEPDERNIVTNTLITIAQIMEDQNPGYLCSILLLDKGARVVIGGAGPSLSRAYNRAVEGLAIGPTVGSCGTAAYWNVPVSVANIQEDFLWRNLAPVAEETGVAACWSHPFSSQDGRVLGALALYHRTPQAPTPEQLSRLKAAARMTGLAVERGRAEEALRVSEAEAQHQSRLLGAVTEVVTSFIDTGDWNSACTNLIQASLRLTNGQFGFLGILRDGTVQVLSPSGVAWGVEGSHDSAAEALAQHVVDGCIRFPHLTKLFEHVLTSGDVVLSNDAATAPYMPQHIPDGYPPVDSFLGAPILELGEVVGFLGITNSPCGFTERDRSTLAALAQAASVSFERRRRQQREAELEQQLLQAAKMEALGVLAGGIAHDFNNLLTAVRGNAELAMMMLPKEEEAHSVLGDIVIASQRAGEFCNQLLAYAGRGNLVRVDVEVNELLRELGGLLQVALSKKADLQYALHPEPLYVHADENQLRQVAMNLVTNASDALGEEEGEIRLVTERIHYSAEALHGLDPTCELPAGNYVKLTVRDTGSGMSAETRAKIFDPFFTTKITGRGLGLAAVKGIVRGHSGLILLDSTLGVGTTFTVLLPVVAPPEVTVEATTGQPSREPNQRRRLLVVDDEPILRALFKKLLTRADYDVVLACDGEEALERFAAEPDAFDCVLLDLSMPKRDGQETFQDLREVRPDVPIVLISGYTEQEVADRFQGATLAGVIQKPPSAATLLAVVKRAVSGRG